MPLRSMNAPKSVMFLTVPLRMSPGRHFGEQLLAALGAFLLDEFAAGEDDVLPLLVDLDDLEFVGVADVTARGSSGVMMSICEAGRKASTPMLTIRPPLTMALTLPAMVPPSLQMVRMRSQFFLNSAFSLERTTMPSLSSSFSIRTSISSPTLTVLMSSNSLRGDDAFALVADVHEDFLGADFDDGAFDDIASGKGQCARLLHGFFHGEHNE